MKPKKDRLFSSPSAGGEFVFDSQVAEVFEDMAQRSIPGYRTIISMIGVLAGQYCQSGSSIYDLGCSLGAATLAIRAQLPNQDCRIIAVDSSAAMIERMASALPKGNGGPKIELRHGDILAEPVTNASMVVLNFTLQFIPLARRYGLLQQIYQGMNPGGILVLSEKIRFPDAQMDQLFVDMYHRFKENQGYSKLEISRKRAALENVLIPETIDEHRERVLKAGFRGLDVWFQCFNFASMVAFK